MAWWEHKVDIFLTNYNFLKRYQSMKIFPIIYRAKKHLDASFFEEQLITPIVVCRFYVFLRIKGKKCVSITLMAM